MANQEHLDILKQGVEVWNEWWHGWWKEQPDIEFANLDADLSGADFSGASLKDVNFYSVNLSGANLSRANLTGAILGKADLTGAHLQNTELRVANLNIARLRGADLRFAHLNVANLSGADLSEVDLTKADLIGADLSGANLNGTNFNSVNVGGTHFGAVDLSVVKELETVTHEFPSFIDLRTVFLSQGNIPEAFLKGTGVPDSFIEYMHSLVGKPIEYYSCFISYSSKDEDFAKRLYADLQSNNVRCWFAPEDMKIGDRIRPRIDESIRLYDRLLLVLSEHSVASKWVEFEVEAAMDKEQEGKPPVLFPVRLDGAVVDSTTAWAVHIKRTRHIGNFSNWKNHDAYKKAFDRLLRDLKHETQ